MDTLRQEKESGQVLVILVVGIMVLLGFAALALDGGMYYSDRRYDQNAADSSSMAGGGGAATSLNENEVSYTSFNCEDPRVEEAIGEAITDAIERAAANGFVIDADITDEHGVQVTCIDAGGETGRYLDVRVMITTTIQTSFAHLIFKGQLENTVEAVTRIIPGVTGPFGDGYAILALHNSCPQTPNCSSNNQGGVNACGNNDITIETGGIYSNACLQKTGNSGNIYAEDGSFYYTVLDDPHNKYQLGTFHTSTRIDLGVDAPDCGGGAGASQLKKTVKKNDTLEVWPGNFDELSLSGGVEYLQMHPGLYCLSGDFTANNGDISIIGTIDEGVTIYLQSGANFDVGGNVHIDLRAPREGTTGTPPAIPGMLIFMQEDYEGYIRLRGNSTSSYRGTVYAKSGEIDFGGNCDMTGEFATQVVGRTVRVHGNPGLVIEFESRDIYEDTTPSSLDLFK